MKSRKHELATDKMVIPAPDTIDVSRYDTARVSTVKSRGQATLDMLNNLIQFSNALITLSVPHLGEFAVKFIARVEADWVVAWCDDGYGTELSYIVWWPDFQQETPFKVYLGAK